MKKLLLLMLGVFVLCTSILAQNRTVTGTITDKAGKPLSNVSVQVKGSTTGTVTNEQGNFTLQVPQSARSLTISSIGYANQEITIGERNSISITLAATDASLEEVVVVGYQTVRKSDVTSAISKISAADIENLPMTNFAQAMQGRAAGVAVSAANGVPGGSLSVVIRGVGSITAGTTPLYVVDGVQLNTGVGSVNTQNNPLNFLNPDDIESIEILKDAAAASIYGARAANGVVLVTTKRGKAGKTRFTVNSYIGQSSVLKKPEVLNSQEWFQGRLEAQTNSNPTASSASNLANTLAVIGLPASTTQKGIDSLPTYDWQDAVFRRGQIRNAEVSMQGGTQNVSFYISGAYSKQETFIAPTDFQRGALLSKISFKINDKLTLDNNISLSTVNQTAPYSLGNTGFGNPAYAAGQILPTNRIYNADGSYYGMPGSGQVINGALTHNIVATSELADYRTRTNQLIGSAALTYKVIPDLTLKTFAALDYRLTQDHRYSDPRLSDAFNDRGRLEDQSDWNTNFLTNTTANYRRTIADQHNINALLGIEYRKDENEYFDSYVTGFPTPLLQYQSAASTPTQVAGGYSASTTFSQFAKLGYSFRNKYIANYTVRRDGSSRFGTNNQYGVFQSAQVAWNAKEEPFLKSVRPISELKLRYSYGEAGNDQIGNVQFRQLYGATRLYGNASAINPTQLGNPDLTWETRVEQNIGLDLGFFNNRISFTADAYKKNNKDLLLSRSLYSTTGFTSITQNLGELENTGLELLLQVVPVQRAVKWTSTFNIAFQKNKLKSLYEGLESLPTDASIRVGYPYGSFFTSEYAGVNPATGRAMWYDANGNITYNPTAADRKIIGNIYPSHFGGWNNTVSFKGFSVDAFFQYEYGRIRQDQQYQQMMRLGHTANSDKEGFDQRWRTPGQVTSVPRPVLNQTESNSVSWATGTRFLYKTDYIRLKQLTLNYDLMASTARKLHLEGVRFYVQGVNLWTYTEWPGYDPEFTGANAGILPQSKNITVGLQVRF